jgi:hypothetical protein
MRKLLSLAVVGVSLALLMSFAGCFQSVESSQDLACDKASDCWDGLPCVEGVCGGKPTPKPEPRPEPVPVPDGAEVSTPEKTPEPIAEIACPVPTPTGTISLCTVDSACLSGTCGSFMIPGCSKPSRACTCTKDDQCKATEKCCTFGNDGVCSSFGCTP